MVCGAGAGTQHGLRTPVCDMHYRHDKVYVSRVMCTGMRWGKGTCSYACVNIPCFPVRPVLSQWEQGSDLSLPALTNVTLQIARAQSRFSLKQTIHFKRTGENSFENTSFYSRLLGDKEEHSLRSIHFEQVYWTSFRAVSYAVGRGALGVEYSDRDWKTLSVFINERLYFQIILLPPLPHGWMGRWWHAIFNISV